MIFALESNENKLSNPFDMSTIGDFYYLNLQRLQAGAIQQAEEERRQKVIELQQN